MFIEFMGAVYLPTAPFCQKNQKASCQTLLIYKRMFACYYGIVIGDINVDLKGVLAVESILSVDIPIQMISCTDTNGKITPLRFRFRDRTGELVTITIDKVLSEDQGRNRVGVNFSCTAIVYGSRKTFDLWYNYFSHEWHLSRLHV